MKKIIFKLQQKLPLLSITILMLFSSISFAQEYECTTPHPAGLSPEPDGGGAVCFDCFLDLPNIGCNNFSQSAPIDFRFTPIKNIKFVLHVVQQNDGSDNFQNTPAHINIMDGIISGVNYRFGANTNNEPPVNNGPSTYIPDTRLRVVRESEIFFHQNSDMWDAGAFQEGCNIYNTLVVNNPEFPDNLIENVIHVFFIGAELTNMGTLN